MKAHSSYELLETEGAEKVWLVVDKFDVNGALYRVDGQQPV